MLGLIDKHKRADFFNSDNVILWRKKKETNKQTNVTLPNGFTKSPIKEDVLQSARKCPVAFPTWPCAFKTMWLTSTHWSWIVNQLFSDTVSGPVCLSEPNTLLTIMDTSFCCSVNSFFYPYLFYLQTNTLFISFEFGIFLNKQILSNTVILLYCNTGKNLFLQGMWSWTKKNQDKLRQTKKN